MKTYDNLDTWWTQDPLASAVLAYVADCSSAIQAGHCDPLIDVVQERAEVAPVLYRGINPESVSVEPGEVGSHWTVEATIGPFLPATTRLEYAVDWAGEGGIVLQLLWVRALELERLLDTHPGFEGTEDATHDGIAVHGMLRREKEWLVATPFTARISNEAVTTRANQAGNPTTVRMVQVEALTNPLELT